MNLPPITLPDPSKPIEDQDLLVLFAMCIFGEARGESDLARRAVAQVVLNRAMHPHLVFGSKTGGQFETNLRGVILRPGQFSSLYPGDPNYSKLWYPLSHANPEIWDRCLACASAAITAKDRADTLTSNSDHYFDDSILPPSWASPSKQTVKIGRLNFFRLYLPHPGESSPENAPPSSGSSPDASLRPSQRSEKTDTEIPAADLSRGSRPSAKILPELATTLPASPASLLGLPEAEPAGPEETPAPGPQSPRPPLSSPAPKSLRAPICGPRSYPWYAWGRRLSLLALLAFALLASACSDLETSAYRVLAVTQAEYETIQDKVAESAARNLITEQQWERFQVIGHRFIAAHNSAVDAFTIWSKTKQPADTARLQAMLDLLPSLVVDINALVDSFSTPPNNSPGQSPNGETVPPPAGPSVQPQLDQPLDAAPSTARVLFHPSNGCMKTREIRRVENPRDFRQGTTLAVPQDVCGQFLFLPASAAAVPFSLAQAFTPGSASPNKNPAPFRGLPLTFLFPIPSSDYRIPFPRPFTKPPTAVIPRSGSDEGSAFPLSPVF